MYNIYNKFYVLLKLLINVRSLFFQKSKSRRHHQDHKKMSNKSLLEGQVKKY